MDETHYVKESKTANLMKCFLVLSFPFISSPTKERKEIHPIGNVLIVTINFQFNPQPTKKETN